MKTTTGIVYAKASLALIVAGFALVGVLIPVGALESCKEPKEWLGAGFAFLVFIVIVTTGVMFAVRRRNVGDPQGDGHRRAWCTTKVASGLANSRPARILCIFTGIAFIAGSMMPIVPVLAGHPLKGDMSAAGRLIFGGIFLLVGLGMANLGIASVICPGAFEPVSRNQETSREQDGSRGDEVQRDGPSGPFQGEE